MNQRIIIFGGAFDPPHNGHLFAVRRLIESNLADQIWIIPSGDRPDKKLTPGKLRLEMTELAFAELISQYPLVSIKDFQVSNKNIGYGTIDLIDFLKKEFPGYRFTFLIGDELLKDLPTWKESERLKDLLEFLVITRESESTPKIPEGFRVTFLPNPENERLEVSSREIRESVKKRKNISKMLNANVIELIKKENLYR